MKKLIIFEGFEAAGKTTLCKLLQQSLNCEYFRSTKQINSGLNLESAIQYDWRFMLDFVSQLKYSQTYIFDRSFISQYVYSYILREERILSIFLTLNDYDQVFKWYCSALQDIDHLVVLCTRENYDGVTDEQVSINMADKMKAKYSEFFSDIGSDLNLLTCKFEDGISVNFNKLVKELKIK